MNRIKRVPLFSALVLMLVVSLAPVVGAAEPSDVPPDHWAYQAVRDLVERGYLPLDEQQAFNGDEPVDRYTLASLTAQILEAIESGGAGISDPQDVRTLQRLIEELREDLVTYYAELQSMHGRVEVVERAVDDFFSKLDEVILGLGTLHRRSQDLENAIELLSDEQRAALAEEVSKLQSAIDSIARSLQVDLGVLQGEIDQLSMLLDTHVRQIDEEQVALRTEISDLLRDLRFDAQTMIDELADEVDGVAARVESVSDRLDSEKAALLTSFAELENRLEAALQQHGMELGATSEEIERFGEEVFTRTQVLAANIDELAQKLDRLESNLQIQAAAIEVIQGQIEEQITREIAQIDSVIRTLDAALSELETTVNAQEEKQSAFAAALEQLRGSLNNQSDEITQLQANLDASVVALQTELAERRAANEALQAEISQLVDQINALDADTDAELSALGEALSVINNDLDRKQSHLEDIESALHELVNYVERLSQDHTLSLSLAESVLQEAIAALQAELALQDETLAAHDQSLTEIAKELVEQRLAHQELEEQVKQIEGRVQSLELTAAALGVQTETLAAADAELLKLIEDLQAENAALNERLSALEANFDLLIHLLEDELASVREDIRILKSQVGFSDEELMMLTREVQNRMNEDLQSALLRERELERGLERLRAEFDSFRETSEKDIGSLRSSQYLSIGALVIGILGLVGN